MRTDVFEYAVNETYTLKGVVFTKTSSWEGLEKWVDADGRVLIVSPQQPTNGFHKSFAELFGGGTPVEKTPKVIVVAGTPDLLSEITVPGNPAPPSAERHGLQQIREAGYNSHPTCVWMQKVAAHALEPLRFPHPGKQPETE